VSAAEYVMANALPGLLTGWRGPVSMDWHIDGEGPFVAEGVVLSTHAALDGERVVWYCDDPRIHRDNRSPMFLRLDLRRPEVRSQIARVLAAGQREPCERCDRGGAGCYECVMGGDRPPWLRKPAPIWHLLPTTEGGTLPAGGDQHAPGLVACSVARVAAGLAPVVGVVVWTAAPAGRPRYAFPVVGGRPPPPPPWDAYTDKEQARRSDELIALGFAILDVDGLGLPWPVSA
jgi:hypothetical protein